ncbi:MAG: MFS transporter [Thiohalocapsa sp.]|uniref:MFS transporter n=1 Tax=Thiohalocapsa sp. TaxID=2497641 RepID=UPI0025EB76CF|nr:MFS transporter [Thiohalocapsa sp.]MCG6942517.1 MFS transporter [Thiohalocapsa sp.]
MPSQPKPGPLPAGIWVLGFVSMLMDISSELIHSLLPVFLLTELGASALVIGLIEGSAEAVALIVRVFSGALSDHLGRRKTLAVAGYGLGALSKPLFAMASSAGMVFAARCIDRVGKGIRGAPRDALVAELAPARARGAAFGLRQALDTVGAFLGPLLAVGLMLLCADDFHAVFWFAALPGALAVALLVLGIREPRSSRRPGQGSPIHWRLLRRLSPVYWAIVVVGVTFTLARFAEAFLVLRAQQGGLPLAWVPLVLVVMNLVYAAAAYPFGRLADRWSRPRLLALGLAVLVAADLVLAHAAGWGLALVGVGLWGLHLGITQGLLSAMIADAAPGDLRGTAFGLFSLLCGFAMLVGSALAGLLWDKLGAAATFYAGAAFCLLALGGLLRTRAGTTEAPRA